ncbi:MAG TPA: PPOX class F420-dependent oxidoreductase [Thermomicrobiales bacterium]|nr:PPOX class F420-dependent oxidoreductase [Thermomicrobiales bacterium]
MNTIPESHRDIIENAQVVVLGTLGAHDEPQITALWFLYEDGVLKMSINSNRQKLKNLQRNPAASAFFLDPATPYRTLELRGDVSIEPDPDYQLATKVGEKYQADLREMDAPEDMRSIVTFNVKNVHTFG